MDLEKIDIKNIPAKYLIPIVFAALMALSLGSCKSDDTSIKKVLPSESPAISKVIDNNETKSNATVSNDVHSANTHETVETTTKIDKSDNVSISSDLGSHTQTAQTNSVVTSGKSIEGISHSDETNQNSRSTTVPVKVEKTKTVDDMKSLFGDMFSKKEGIETKYILNDLVFNEKNHKITNYTKSEVEGLAKALKDKVNSKIEIQVYTDDSNKANENEKLSKKRAQVVRQMLVTLGVKEKQISVKGMGEKDLAKAKYDRVEILVK